MKPTPCDACCGLGYYIPDRTPYEIDDHGHTAPCPDCGGRGWTGTPRAIPDAADFTGLHPIHRDLHNCHEVIEPRQSMRGMGTWWEMGKATP